ncbi:MAG TPA: hypothetical protein VHS76_03160 [Steroidobacteraceae bacterium]|jgi:hypothetical protein|nr:hypothetical protein [Steroidobacteraceae bacterium]
MDDLVEDLGRSPELFPYALDLPGDSVTFIRLKKSEFERASFLDARLLTPQTRHRALDWARLEAAIEAAGLHEHCGFIFHIGHVGSTLLSRLIGTHDAVFSLREPAILRTFAQLDDERGAQPRAWPHFGARVGFGLKLLSRTFESRQLAVVKATSFVSELAPELLSRSSSPKAVLMFVSPESYIATILGGPNSRQEAKLLATNRLRRLHRRIGDEIWQLADLTEGEVLALAWACEMSALAQAAEPSARRRVCRVDFDRFLDDPAALLLSVLQHFDVPATATEVEAILKGPDMRRYSKAPEHAYDAALRREVLNHARAMHAAEIRRGLAWLDRAAARFAPVRRALAFAQ